MADKDVGVEGANAGRGRIPETDTAGARRGNVHTNVRWASSSDINVVIPQCRQPQFLARGGDLHGKSGIYCSGVSLAPGRITSAIPQVAKLSEVQTCA
jgi:hypothetical protein